MPQLGTGARGISARGCRQLISHHRPGSLPASSCYPWERFSSSLRFLPIREAQKPASNQNHRNTQQNPLNPTAGTSRKPQCTKSHPEAATTRYRHCPGTSGIPSDTEHAAGPALVGRTHGAATSAEPSAQPAPWARVQCGSCRGEPSPCQHWCCPHHKPPDRIREAGQSFNYSWLPGAKQLN